MSEPGICPSCGSDRVRVVDARYMKPPYQYRRRECRLCHHRYSMNGRTEVSAEGVRVTIEAPTLRLLERAWQRFQKSLST